MTSHLFRLAALTSLIAAPLAAQDECSSAAALSSGLTIGSNVGATTSAVTGSCGSMGSDVWYTFTVSAPGNALVSFCAPGATASYDTVLAAFEGTCGSLTEVACNDDTCGLSSELIFRAMPGKTYYVAVGGFSGDQGDFTMLYALRDAPRNDDCGRPAPITNGLTSGDTFGSSRGPFFGTCGPMSSDVWYEYTATCDGTATASFCAPGASADHDTMLAAFVGDCHTMTEIACNDDAFCGLLSEISFPVTAGQRYLVAVGGYEGAQGGFVLSMDCTADSSGGSITPWAVQSMRVGSPANPPAFVVDTKSPPITGQTWDPVVKHGAFMPEALGDLMLISAGPAVNVPSTLGTLLCPVSPATLVATTAPGTRFAIPIPNDPNVIGVSLCTQGATFDPTRFQLLNGMDITIAAQ